ncbi:MULTISPECIES: hypothetical protein [unclassified Brevibacterium]|uniref:hypothetical protein n=1 Tax=unclassified Brevibacterium TaxID=2614124 RepID=UPI0011AF3D36|nr:MULTISPECIES: hypothetical protein [unclassified Brevibacterium]MCF2572895.1 hypothetical protein [Brevibacterium sp. UCMA 11754]
MWDGYQQIANLNYEVAGLKLDITLGQGTDGRYQEVADFGNELLDICDDEGYEWDYEFVSDVSQIEA